MKMFSFVYSLSDNMRVKYYESIVKNGFVNDELWDEIILHIENNFKKVNNVEEEIKKILKNIDVNEKKSLLQLIKCNNEKLYDKLSIYIFNFEDIINVDHDLVKQILKKYSLEEIYKATMGASPTTKEFIKSLMNTIDFDGIGKDMRTVSIHEIVDIHNKILNEINELRSNI